ncbi:MAG: hypothetical protein HQL04_00370 [Nitrospirae bacterium]|nr:hypothetical protein [Nitrospirota bacterium]
MKNKDMTKDNNNGNVGRNEFEAFKEMFVELKAMFIELARNQHEMMQKQDRMAKDIGTLKTDVGTLKTDVGTLKTDVGTLKTDVASIRRDIGGLSKSVSYALENEAYRELPRFLKDKYGIEMSERLIRAEVKKDCEINILGKGTKHGRPVLIVGEAKLRLQGSQQQMTKVFHQLERNVEAVRLKYKDFDIVSILITHFATADFLTYASNRGVIVIQSFEW